ncbi:amino acid ABC transporter ATP-binding protein [Mesorhizobium australicum]|nr:amino acid ABC transporter ATP-binding protein [Mesorhizobium australicum]
MTLATESKEVESEKVGPSGGPILELSAVAKNFGGVQVLKGVDLRVDKSELVFLIGPSGSGKSTLLRCCNHLELPTSGHILFEGVDIAGRGVNINTVRQKIGMVFQSFNLYQHMTALQNVTLALRKVAGKPRAEADAIGMAMLDRVEMAHRAGYYPSQLSGGQQQRVAIARTLALDPKVVLFDEPTSALDPELVDGVLQVMHDLRRSGMTMLVVSHEMRFARDAADRVVFMADGNIVEQGSPDRIFTAPSHPRTKNFLASVLR